MESKLWFLPMLEQKSCFDSSNMQGHVLRFNGRFEWFEAILADNIPKNVKKVLKMRIFGKAPGVNG